MHTFVVTGGHHNSGLVIAKALKDQGERIYWIGHRFSSRGDKVDSAEYNEVKAAGISFFDLNAAKLVLDIREFIRFPIGIFLAYRYLVRVRPTAIISFGGYLGGTVAIAAWLLNIKIFLHEQTVSAGRSNKLIARLSQKVYLTWPQSAKLFHKSNTLICGLPLRPSILFSKQVKLFKRVKPTLLVMGGKQGATIINKFTFSHILELLKDFNIVHQTGTSSLTLDYQKSLFLKDELNSLSDSYLPLGYISESEIGKYLSSSDIYLGRSGAHICYELGCLGLKSILVPLMSTHDHEQLKNAAILESAQIGVILPQSNLSYPHFKESLKALANLKAKPLELPTDATKVMIKDILKEL